MKIYYSKKDADTQFDKDCALSPPSFLYAGEADTAEYSKFQRRWQSAPTIAKTPGGRLFCVYSGDNSVGEEGPNNYNVISYSDDDGLTWVSEYLVIDHPDPVRMHEPILWVSPEGELWHFFAQSFVWWDGRGGVWACKCADPGSVCPRWSEPVRLCDGVMATKPIVRANGDWLFPVSIWKNIRSKFNTFPELEYSNVYVSRDGGKTLSYVGSANEPDTTFDENNLIERADGSLMMLMRTKIGIAVSDSSDGGVSWTTPKPFILPGPSSRLYLGKFPSGAFVIVTHYNFTGRSHMTALLSDDGGRNWNCHLLLDERSKVSYPDGFIDETGRLYAVYDRERYIAREILMAKITEEDIRAGACIADGSSLKNLIISSASAKQD